ncbi:MAG: exo-alpha-sialidase [Cyclobacteriaceae bacterium]
MYKLQYILPALLVALVSCKTNKDGGEKLSLLDSPTTDNTEEPFLCAGADGNVYLSWIEKQASLTTLKYSMLVDGKWSDEAKIAEGDRWFVNWADHPVLAVNKNGDMMAHYLEMSDTGTYTYDIKIVTKKSENSQWSAPFTLHDDGIKAEHGFVSMSPLENGNFFLTWLDGRNTSGGHHGHHEGGAMTIRAAILNSEGEKLEEWPLDQRVCDCCQTTNGVAANGLVAVYRDRSDDEMRDMSYVSYTNNEWGEPRTLFAHNWKIHGCPVNGPSLSTSDNRVAVGWFSAAEGEPKVQVIFSENSGETFGAPVRLDQGKAIGRVKTTFIDPNTVFATWMEEGQIVGASVNQNNEITQRYVLANSSAQRSSGFPQLAKWEDTKIVIAWTDPALKRIKTGFIKL